LNHKINYIFIALILGFSVFRLQSQENHYHGVVVDSNTGTSLPFVTILFNTSGRGTTSQIDGRFSIPADRGITTLTFSCVGYHSEWYDLTGSNINKTIVIRLKAKAYRIDEVKVFPEINPAHRIIEKVYENRKINDPEERESFTYTAYNKFYITMDADSLAGIDSLSLPDFEQNPFSIPDSNLARLGELIKKQHLFLLESVSQREFRHPDQNSEKVIASRVSGFKNPTFSIIATQIQSFSFYNDFIRIMEKDYLNPVSKGSTNKYLFVLEDTIYTENNDSLFVISFQPKNGKVFDGMEGFFHINSNRYAIQNVVATAPGPNNMMDITIQQKYALLEGTQWFPVQLNTDLTIYGPQTVGSAGKDNPLKLYGIGKTTLSDIQLNPLLERKRFDGLEFEVEQGATKKQEEFWEQYRTEALTAKDTTTYHVVDSLGRELNLDRRLNTFETFVTGYIPFRFLNIDYTSLLNYNDYEGIRIGVGAVTNNKLSRFVSLGGYFAYGFRDNEIKYGGKISVKISEDPVIKLETAYRNDVEEPGGYHFLKERTEISSEAYRVYLIEEMDQFAEYKISLSYHSHRHLQARLYLGQRLVTFGKDYLFSYDDTNPKVYLGNSRYTEIGLSFRFAYKEKFLKISDQFVSVGTEYPVLCGNIIQGINWFDSQLEYTKLEMKLSKLIRTRNLGEVGLTLTGGMVSGDVPFSLLYNGNGSYKDFTVETANSFATMRMDEFASDRFVSFFYQQNFGEIRPPSKTFRPSIVWINNIGFGERKTSDNHSNLQRKTMEKGYFESGILINDLLNQWFFGIGIGAFYRYGPYSLTKTIDNFAFKFTITVNI